MYKNTHLFKLLITAASDVNAKSTLGDTSLHLATISGFLPVAMHLLIAGANANEPNKMGSTLLNAAAKKGYDSILKLLLDCDVNTDACELQACVTALHIAVLLELDHTVQILIPSSNLFYLDCEGRSPYEVAKEKGNASIVASLGLAMKEFHQRKRFYSFPLLNEISYVP